MVEQKQMLCRGWLELHDGMKSKEFNFQVSDTAKEPIGKRLRAGTIEIAVGEALKRNILGSLKDWLDPQKMEDLGDELYLGSGHVSHQMVEGVLHIVVDYT